MKKKDIYNSDNGMISNIWGPPLWHFLHTISFNYPINPTNLQRKHYKQYMLSLGNILPCKYCRINYKKNLLAVPLTNYSLKNRNTFSRWVYRLHSNVNDMLGKKTNITYNEVKEKYNKFRAGCNDSTGCINPLQKKS